MSLFRNTFAIKLAQSARYAGTCRALIWCLALSEARGIWW